MNASRVVLLLVALGAGGLAAFLATQRDLVVSSAIAEPADEVVPEAKTQILVAKEPIGVGQRLSAASLGWEDWPEKAVRPEHITVAAAPEAITDMSGSVVRSEILPGEPIREEKLVPAGEGSRLSAVLGSGMRAVSVSVAAESASGGFIVPNDHVDVVLTRSSTAAQISETVLPNVRVLAINARLGQAETEESEGPEVFTKQAIATLELDPTQAEIIMTAGTLGRLSLILRSAGDFAATGGTAQRAANQAIRISSPFWSR